MKILPQALMLLFVFACAGWSIELQGDFDAGQRCYRATNFKKAVSHFSRVVAADPSDAESHFWLGKSYENLADIDGPLLGVRASSKARAHLAMALRLASANREYRREYFDFLLLSDTSPGALREALAIIQKTPRSDPDYPSMSLQLERERSARSSAELRIEGAVSALPRALTRASLASVPAPQDDTSLTLVAQSGR